MTDHISNIAKTLGTIDTDLSVGGANQPARLYQLIDDIEDPTAQLLGVLPTYPPSDLQAGYDAGSRVPEYVHGLVLSSSGARHLTYPEVVERNAEMPTKIKAAVERQNNGTPIPEDKLQETLEAYYNDVMIPAMPNPLQLPPFMRVDIRMTVAVLRDGTVHKLIHESDKEPAELFTGRVEGNENFPTALYMFLHGLRPADCDDPITVVSDYKTLEALSALPTADER